MSNSQNANLHKAKSAKNDEFYTQLTDIEKELGHYKDHFKDKVVFLNCDDPKESNFWKYFSLNFKYLKLKKLVATHYDSTEPTYKLEYDGRNTIETKLKQNGDFRSSESIEILKKADIVVTNPPFSLFREYVAQLIEYDKNFLIIGNQNAVITKEIFPLIQNNKLWLGLTMDGRNKWFRIPNHYIKYDKIENGDKYAFVKAVVWFTNLTHKRRNEELILYKEYNEEDYPTYDNYDAIEVSRVKNIPKDYDDVMGVPITFLHKYNPDQFEIIWQASGNTRASAPKEILQELSYKQHNEDRGGCGVIDEKRIYSRILIKAK